MWMKGKQAIVLLSAQLRRLEVTSWKSKETQAARVLQHGWICYMSRRFFRRLRELQAREVESRLRGERQRRSGRTGQQEGRGKERTRSQLNEGKEEEACKPGLPLPATISKLRLRQSFRLNLELLKGGGKSSLADNEEGKDVEVVLRAANEQVEQSYKKFLEKRRSGSEEKEKGGKDRKRKEEKGGRRMEVPEEEREKMAGGRETERAESRSSSLRLRERVAALSALYDEPEKREEAGLQLGNVSAREELDSPASSSSSRRSSSRAASPKKWTQTRPQEMRDSTALLDAFLEVPTPRTTRSMRTKTKTTGAWDSEGLYSILDFVGKDRLGGAAAARGGGGAGGGGGGGGGGRLYKRSQSAKTRRNEAGAAERFALKLAEMKQEEASAGNLKQANPYEEPMKRSFAVRP
ncbi:hypothetical protein GUITHDRAFT_121468 [Guillardia theta CCMP2712]|uniref:Uncharacterized protein n=1 Tax=Guillardia theta (strain CCMP2712) TaxID=905079 RepID=L1I816_GUITC|nr:hypothetical protein GUITHDRAFT_121468 [Guillardia theta CCMP2712]EKX32358.1 hypothetical protein GUITHDRAFT_121468 [Guillardia theta CCMP2712]|eukprot:XP_005819338.1 hypothetical protein GUITHDRAFT_121468 [Guillardia theta CCMP2712]